VRLNNTGRISFGYNALLMTQPLTILVTVLATLVVTILSGILLDFIRNARPAISYSVKEAVAIDLGDHKRIGAYVVSMLNTSRRVIKELTCHIEAGGANFATVALKPLRGLNATFRRTTRFFWSPCPT
jgi:hypothetical protein